MLVCAQVRCVVRCEGGGLFPSLLHSLGRRTSIPPSCPSPARASRVDDATPVRRRPAYCAVRCGIIFRVGGCEAPRPTPLSVGPAQGWSLSVHGVVTVVLADAISAKKKNNVYYFWEISRIQRQFKVEVRVNKMWYYIECAILETLIGVSSR